MTVTEQLDLTARIRMWYICAETNIVAIMENGDLRFYEEINTFRHGVPPLTLEALGVNKK